MPDYFCSVCRKPCGVRMYESGVSSDCHEESRLMVSFCPSYPDKCNGCETRPLTPDEQTELTEQLAAELDAERSPAERARARVREGV